MIDIRNIEPKVLNRGVDFVVLGTTFFVSCLLFSGIQAHYCTSSTDSNLATPFGPLHFQRHCQRALS